MICANGQVRPQIVTAKCFESQAESSNAKGGDAELCKIFGCIKDNSRIVSDAA